MQQGTDANGQPTYSMVPIPGSPADMEAKQSAQDEAKRQDVQTVTSAEKSNTMLDATQEIDNLLKSSSTPVTGTLSRPFAMYSDSPAGRVRSLVTTLKSGVALNAMLRLKEASKTGATGFGQLSEKELALLISDIGALDPDTTAPDIFAKTVDRIKQRYVRVVDDIRRNVSPERIQELGLEPVLNSIGNPIPTPQPKEQSGSSMEGWKIEEVQ